MRTNNPVCGAFRGFGANQAQFAAEGLIDRLAAAAGLSAWEMRARNAARPGDTWGPGQVMDDGCLGALDCLEAVRPAWEEAVAAGKAVGLGLGLKNSGLGNGAVVGVAAAAIAAWWFGNPVIGLILGLALVINLIVAALVGTAVPLAFRALGLDPATGSSVFVTPCTDMTGFAVFLGLATAFIQYLR